MKKTLYTLLVLFLIIGTVSAQNTTNETNTTQQQVTTQETSDGFDAGETIQKVSDTAKTGVDWMKQNVPYEFLLIAVIGLTLYAFMAKGASGTEDKLFKLALYMALAGVAIWVLLLA
jgi:hypothetical protein